MKQTQFETLLQTYYFSFIYNSQYIELIQMPISKRLAIKFVLCIFIEKIKVTFGAILYSMGRC